MNFKYKLFGIFFNFFRLFSRNPRDIVFIIDNKISFNTDLEYIKEELDKRANFNYHYIFKEEYSSNDFDQHNQSTKNNEIKNKLRFLFKSLEFFLVKSYQLSKGKYVFLNDNFFPIAYMNFNNDTIVVQLWHALGAFKRFGIPVLYDENMKNLIEACGLKTDYLFVSSHNVSKIYSEAFAVDEKKILPTSLPKMDYYFRKNIHKEENITKIKSKLKNQYSKIDSSWELNDNQISNNKNNFKDMKIILYAPTFREGQKFNNDIPNHFDFDLFNEELGSDYCILFKSHPKFNINPPKHVVDVSNYDNIQELLFVTDILITDYSSIMVEYSALSKPIIFYPYDLDYYNSKERGFYFNYNNVPGPIAENTMDVINIIKQNDFDFKKIEDFANYSFDYFDDNSSRRIVDNIFK